MVRRSYQWYQSQATEWILFWEEKGTRSRSRIDSKQCKDEIPQTLTLDRKDGKEKDLPGPYLALAQPLPALPWCTLCGWTGRVELSPDLRRSPV
jgi:hypothetical protein